MLTMVMLPAGLVSLCNSLPSSVGLTRVVALLSGLRQLPVIEAGSAAATVRLGGSARGDRTSDTMLPAPGSAATQAPWLGLK